MEKIIKQEQIQRIFLPLLRKRGQLYNKHKQVFAKVASGGEQIESITSSGKETVNTASEGDYIVQNQTSAKEWYVVPAEKFNNRYEYIRKLENGLSLYKPKGQVFALKLNSKILKELELESIFHFEAPWGESQVACKEDFMATPPDFSEVYRIGKKEFKETYQKAKNSTPDQKK